MPDGAGARSSFWRDMRAGAYEGVGRTCIRPGSASAGVAPGVIAFDGYDAAERYGALFPCSHQAGCALQCSANFGKDRRGASARWPIRGGGRRCGRSNLALVRKPLLLSPRSVPGCRNESGRIVSCRSPRKSNPQHDPGSCIRHVHDRARAGNEDFRIDANVCGFYARFVAVRCDMALLHSPAYVEALASRSSCCFVSEQHDAI